MHDQNNVFYAIVLSAVILITWQYFFATSFLSKPAAPKTSQARAVAPGIETIRPQPQALGTQTATSIGPATISAVLAARGAWQIATRRHRYAPAERINCVDRGKDRRSFPGSISRNHRSKVSCYRIAFTLRQPATILRGIRLGRWLQRQSQSAHLGDGLAPAGIG